MVTIQELRAEVAAIDPEGVDGIVKQITACARFLGTAKPAPGAPFDDYLLPWSISHLEVMERLGLIEPKGGVRFVDHEDVWYGPTEKMMGLYESLPPG